MYAGVCETNITPPPDVWMGGYAGRERALGVHDELYARALVLDNGAERLVLLVADLIATSVAWADEVRTAVARALHTRREAVMLHCTHTHGGPYLYPFKENFRSEPSFGQAHEALHEASHDSSLADEPKEQEEQEERTDVAYETILRRKLVGVALQAATRLQPAHLTYGEASAQIGVNRRQTVPIRSGNISDTVADNNNVNKSIYKTILGVNYGGPVAPLVQTLCVNSVDGRTFALLFSHACHPTTRDGQNRYITADWPGAAVAHLKRRFLAESTDSGIATDALPIFLQGCCGDINPLQRGDWDAVQTNGRIVADAAHTARWNAHGRMTDELDCAEIAVEGLASPFTVQRLTLGGATIIGFPAEMFVQYQIDLQSSFRSENAGPLFCLGYTNGCLGYLAPEAEYGRGGYEIDEAYRYYGTPNFTPQSEHILKRALKPHT